MRLKDLQKTGFFATLILMMKFGNKRKLMKQKE